MKRRTFALVLVAVLAVVLGISSAGWAKDKDNNPPGAAGGPGTNWENPPGAAGGPGASPDVKGPPPKHHYKHKKYCKHHPNDPKCHYVPPANPPGPAGGPGPNPPPPPGKPPKDLDNNPPGAKGGPGTNWENPPGAKGGPGASPNKKPPKP